MDKVQNGNATAGSFAVALGDLLTKARNNRGLTRDQVLAKVSPSMSLSTLRRIETGAKAPDVVELRSLVAAINTLNPEADFPDVTVPALIEKAEAAVTITTSVADSTSPE